VKASRILVVNILVVIALAAMLTQFVPSTASQVSVRFSIVSDVNVTKYHVDALAGYWYSIATFVRDGVLYIAYDNLVNGSNIVRVDTGEVVKVCSFSDYAYFDHIVAGKGTAYGVMSYWVSGTGEWGTKIIDLWSCSVLAVFENATSYFIRYSDWLFRYDMYADKLLYAFFVYNRTANAELNYIALVDVATGNVKELFLGVLYNRSENRWYVDLLGLYAGPDYYYIVIEDLRTNPPTDTMYIYDKNLEHLVGTVPWDPNATKVHVWYGSSDLAINVYGVLQHKYVQDDGTGNYWFKLVMHDALFSKATEYVTDVDNVATNMGGVAAYRDLFVFHNGKSAYSVGRVRVPYAFILLPSIGLAVNTSIAGFAIPVDYELWSSNRVVLFNPATGDVYLVDPPAVTYTVTETVVFTTTVTETIFTTTVFTTAVTETVSPPPSFTISPSLSLMLPIVITAGIVGFIGALSVLKSSLEHTAVFVKKKRARS
jgi:hypothetical protein